MGSVSPTDRRKLRKLRPLVTGGVVSCQDGSQYSITKYLHEQACMITPTPVLCPGLLKANGCPVMCGDYVASALRELADRAQRITEVTEPMTAYLRMDRDHMTVTAARNKDPLDQSNGLHIGHVLLETVISCKVATNTLIDDHEELEMTPSYSNEFAAVRQQLISAGSHCIKFMTHACRREGSELVVRTMCDVRVWACPGCMGIHRSAKYCAGCGWNVFCSKDCQTASWDTHKPMCKGRYPLLVIMPGTNSEMAVGKRGNTWVILPRSEQVGDRKLVVGATRIGRIIADHRC